MTNWKNGVMSPAEYGDIFEDENGERVMFVHWLNDLDTNDWARVLRFSGWLVNQITERRLNKYERVPDES